MVKREIEVAGEGGFVTPSVPSTRPFASPQSPPAPRTGEVDANVLNDLKEQFAKLQQRYDAIVTAHCELNTQYSVVQRERRNDQDRFGLAERARRSLEANSREQIKSLRDLQANIAERDTTIARLSEQFAKLEHFDLVRSELISLQDLYQNLQRQRSSDLERITAMERARKARDADPLRSAPDVRETAASRPVGAAQKTTENGQDRPTERVVNRAPPSLAGQVLARWTVKRARGAARGGRWGEAAAMYQAALAIGDAPGLQKQLGHVLREQGRFAAAVGAYRQAIAADPNDGENHFMLGLSEAKQGNAVAARAAYTRALALTPTLADKYSELRDFASRG